MTRFLIFAFLFSGSLSLAANNQICLKGDCFNGYGEVQLSDGSIYKGNFLRGAITGKGILYSADNSQYNGNWINNKREGKGKLFLQNGDVYFGQFKMDNLHGKGVMKYANGDEYNGEWKSNKPNGAGTYAFASGEKYVGEFLNGKFHGSGTYYFKDGRIHDGQWSDNERNGEGKMTLTNGKIVMGTWLDDVFSGDPSVFRDEPIVKREAKNSNLLKNCNSGFCHETKGRFVYANNSIYYGDFKNNRPHGKGVLKYADGNIYEGAFYDGEPHGLGKLTYADGGFIKGEWFEGQALNVRINDSANDAMSKPVEGWSTTVDIYAVVVGVGDYDYTQKLRYTDDDAYRMNAHLKSPQGGALKDDQIKVLVDQQATRENVLDAMREVYARADEDDVVLFFFSGHGLKGSFLPVDYNGRRVIEHSEIANILKESKAKHKIVIADACHSGSLEDDLVAKGVYSEMVKSYYDALLKSRGGLALLLSSREEEISLEDESIRSGVFSHYVESGLKGYADTNKDKVITIQELFEYVNREVRKHTMDTQTPVLSGNFDPYMPVGMVNN